MLHSGVVMYFVCNQNVTISIFVNDTVDIVNTKIYILLVFCQI